MAHSRSELAIRFPVFDESRELPVVAVYDAPVGRDEREELISRMVEGGGARAESFFVSRGLGLAYDSVSRGYGIRKRMNAALLAAEKTGRLDEVVVEGRWQYGLVEGGALADLPRPRRKIVQTGDAHGRLFISHASADAELADAIADLLRLGTGLSHERILCTSLEGMGVPEGEYDYLEYLRTELSDAMLVLPLLTPSFFVSEMCLVELGAMWGAQLTTIPVVVPPVSFARVEKLLGKVQAIGIDKASGLAQLHDRIVHEFSLDARTDMWEVKRSQFEKRIPALLEGLAKPASVPLADLDRERGQVDKLARRIRILESELDASRGQVQAISELKDAEDVAAVLSSTDDELVTFRKIVESATEACQALPPAVRRAMYENQGRDDWFRPEPFSSDADGAARAEREDLLRYSEDDGGYWINDSDPAVEAAKIELEALFDTQWSAEVVLSIFRAMHGKNFSRNSAATWRALGLY